MPPIESQSVDLKLYAVPVAFDPLASPPIYFPAGSAVEVSSRMALVAFCLDPLPAGVIAGFSATPIDWLDMGGRIVPSPACFRVVTCNPDRVAVLDTNLGSADATFQLALNIAYNGLVYSSPDPTILNKEDPIGP